MKKSRGFTLIELMVVIVIIGILAAIAIPKFMEASVKAKFGEVPVIMASYDHAQLARLAETGSLGGDMSELVMDTPNSKWFSYTHGGGGAAEASYTSAILANGMVGSLTTAMNGARTRIAVSGTPTHEANDFVKYLPAFK
jgi:prepilin-type N-terminal cleavage/methylation domain-containing protein